MAREVGYLERATKKRIVRLDLYEISFVGCTDASAAAWAWRD